MAQIVTQTLDASSDEEKADYGVIKRKIRADLKRYISKQTLAATVDYAGDPGNLARV